MSRFDVPDHPEDFWTEIFQRYAMDKPATELPGRSSTEHSNEEDPKSSHLYVIHPTNIEIGTGEDLERNVEDQPSEERVIEEDSTNLTTTDDGNLFSYLTKEHDHAENPCVHGLLPFPPKPKMYSAGYQLAKPCSKPLCIYTNNLDEMARRVLEIEEEMRRSEQGQELPPIKGHDCCGIRYPSDKNSSRYLQWLLTQEGAEPQYVDKEHSLLSQYDDKPEDAFLLRYIAERDKEGHQSEGDQNELLEQHTSSDETAEQKIPSPMDFWPSSGCCGIRFAPEQESNKYLKWLLAQDELESQNHSDSSSGSSSHKEEELEDRQLQFFDGGLKLTDEDVIYLGITDMTYRCFTNAKDAERKVLTIAFDDYSFTEWSELLVQHWLPTVPKLYKRHMITYSRAIFLLQAFYLIQHFQIGLEQMVQDQKHYRGPFLDTYDKLLQELDRVIVDFKKKMRLLKLTNFAALNRSRMPKPFRDRVTIELCRNLRDYTILTQYIKSTSFITRGLCCLHYKFTF